MNKEHLKILQKNRTFIVENLTTDAIESICDVLLGNGILTSGLAEILLKKTPKPQGQTRELLTLLAKRGPKAYTSFIDALNQTGNEFIAEKLTAYLPKAPPGEEKNVHKTPIAADFQLFQDGDNMPRVISKGQYSSFENRAYLAGACNVGKTTLASVLIGKTIPSTWESTDGLNIYFGRNGIDLVNKKMIPLKEGSAGHSVYGKVLLGNPSVQNQPAESVSAFDPNAQEDVEEENSAGITKSAGNTSASIAAKISRLGHYKIRDGILKEIQAGQYRVKIAPSDLVDFGGQRSYDMTHQLFIQHNGSFMLMFDGRYKLTQQLNEYRQECMTSKSILIHWVNSILTYCTEDDTVLPQILFIATHSDEFTEEQVETRKKQFEKEITELFDKHDKRKHINCERVYFINATNKDDNEIRELTDKLVDIAFKQPSWGQKRPMAWVPLELQIEQLRSENVNIISKKDLRDINKMNVEQALNKNQLEDFLLKQHSIGKIMYFNQPGLDEFIITQPLALVKILRSFITDKMFWPKDIDLNIILQNLYVTGKLSHADLIKLWSQLQIDQIMPNNKVKEYIIAVLINLDILVERKRRDRSGKNECPKEYLVPCVVKRNEADAFLNDDKFENKTICLVYNLKWSSIPSALAFKLIGAAISIWPLKEEKEEDKEGKMYDCLYHQSAVVCIDESNELRIQVKENQIVIYLSHESMLTSISPDVAASIQECLTKTLENVILFYRNSFGKYSKTVNVADLFEMKVGVVCQKSPCVESVDVIKGKNHWTCHNARSHEPKYPLKWVFEKKVQSCPEDCTGLNQEEFRNCPESKHLFRLAEQLTNDQCRELVIYLGMKKEEWEQICEQDRNVVLANFKALYKWKDDMWKGCKDGTFEHLSKAFKSIKDEQHHLCQIFREKTELFDVADNRLQEKPNDDVLEELPRQMGNCTLHLCIELGLTIYDYDSTMTENRNMYTQILSILHKWRSTSKAPTTLRLMQALQRVHGGGLNFMRKKMDI